MQFRYKVFHVQMTETFPQTRRARREAARISDRRAARRRAVHVGRHAAVVLGTSGLVITSTVSAVATESVDGRAQTTLDVDLATHTAEQAEPAAQTTVEAQPETVTASDEIELAFDRPAVTSEAASVPEATPASVTSEAATATETASVTETTTEATSEATVTSEASDATATTAAAAEPVAAGGSVVSAAYGGLGVHYRWAGSSPSTGFDCSGFINWAYAQAGRPLPGGARSTHGMLASLPRVSTPQPGDIVISTGVRSSHHAGIYVGNGQVIGALSATGVTQHGYYDSWHNVVAILRPAY